MSDLSHQFGTDLRLTPQGGLSLSSGTLLVQENCFRRLLTTPGDVLYLPEYGAGLEAAVGKPLNEARLQAQVLKNLRLEPLINQTAPVNVSVDADATQSLITITVEFSDVFGQTSALNLQT